MNARYGLLGLRDALLRGEEPAPAEFLTNRSYYPWLVVGTVCIGAFIGQVDASIVQLALPTLEREFDARLHIVSWVAVGYVLAFASILPVFARLAEIMGRKLMYLVGCRSCSTSTPAGNRRASIAAIKTTPLRSWYDRR